MEKTQTPNLIQPTIQDSFYLIEKDSKTPVPLKSIDFKVNIVQSVAEFQMIQEYSNLEDQPLETVFLHPVEVSQIISKMTIQFREQNGNVTDMETKVIEREKVQFKTEDGSTQKKTPVIRYLTKFQGKMTKIEVGTFPPLCDATIVLYYYQELEVNDASYCLKIPTTLFPKYMGDKPQMNQVLLDDEKLQTKQGISENQTSGKQSYLWNLEINIKMNGKIQRLSSRNHQIEYVLNQDETEAKISLSNVERNNIRKSFILLFRDDQINDFAAFKYKNQFGENAILVNWLPDFRRPQIKESLQQKLKDKQAVDTDPLLIYNPQISYQSELGIQQKAIEYIFIINRNGSLDDLRVIYSIEALKLLIQSLPIGTLFNVYSTVKNEKQLNPQIKILIDDVGLFQSSVEYNDQTKEEALNTVSQFKAEYGGVKILEIIKEIFENKSEVKERHIYLLSDDRVSSTQEIVEIISNERGNSKVYTIGFGDKTNTDFLKKCAKAGQGHFALVTDLNEMEVAVVETLYKTQLDYLQINKVELLDENKNLIETILENKQIMHGYNLRISKILDKQQQSPFYVQAEFYYPKTMKSEKKIVLIQDLENGEIINKIAAGKLTDEMELNDSTAIGLKYGILKGNTSMVICKKSVDAYTKEVKLIPIPVSKMKNDKIEIFIKPIDGKTFSVFCYQDDDIYYIKERIQDREGIPPDQSRLIYKGIQLDDYKTVKDYELGNQCTLHQVLRLRIKEKIYVKDRFSSAKHSIAYDLAFTLGYMRQILRKKLGCNEKDLKIFRNGQEIDKSQDKVDVKTLGLEPDSHELEYIQISYKLFAFKQSANGNWGEKLYDLLKQKSELEIREIQTNEDIKALDITAILTLIGIHILTIDFAENAKEWKLVAQKARGYLKKTHSLQDDKIDKFVNDVTFEREI